MLAGAGWVWCGSVVMLPRQQGTTRGLTTLLVFGWASHSCRPLQHWRSRRCHRWLLSLQISGAIPAAAGGNSHCWLPLPPLPVEQRPVAATAAAVQLLLPPCAANNGCT